MNFFPGSAKQNSCLVDSNIPGIFDFIHKETEESGNEGLKIVDDAREEMIDEETMKQNDDVVDSSYDEEADNSAEKIDVEAEVHEECEV